MSINPYIHMDGRCEEAFRFYEEVLGGKIDYIQTYADSPMAEQFGPEMATKIMHVSLNVDGAMLFGSDAPPEYFEKPQGFSVSLNYSDVDKGRAVFDALAQGGHVKMPFETTFWAKGFGMVTDRYGTPWMVNVQ